MVSLLLSITLATAAAASSFLTHRATNTTAGGVNSTTCNGKTYVYEELAAYGLVVSDAVDKFGDTLGGLGSAIYLDKKSWRKSCNGTYTGTLWTLPDRGWNTEGTLNFQPRVHKFTVSLTPAPNATVEEPSSPNLIFQYLDTIRFSGPDSTPCTGIDADVTGHLSYPGFPDLPVATYTGDGFGGNGTGGRRIPVDCEGLVVNDDGSFWISDEYGPYVYLFDHSGKMLAAIRPPDAIIPFRNGTESFSAASPPHYIDDGEGPLPNPEHPDTGRENNHGFEGLTASDDGKTLWVLLQAATVQEGGLEKQTQRYTRFLEYDVSTPQTPVYVSEYIVPLPAYVDPTAKASKNPKIAAQSEIHALANGQFFVLARDSGAGHGQDDSTSVYRHIDVFDISGATDIKGPGYDSAAGAVADAATGALKTGVDVAAYCGFLDFNVNSQLGRFGLHNGGAQDAALLNEKWESLAVVPVDPQSPGDEYFVFSLSDNDFITQNGFMNNGRFAYADSSGYSLDSQALVFKVRIPS
ncbi:hypothetical protein TruAng_008565 [Truncatella angustata]|nr:hypothetical protein TruAng_008565 [Truncatella angustata]